MRQLVTILLISSISIHAHAVDWPHWRGPNRDDITNEDSGWTQGAWPLKKPRWQISIGVGCTSPIVVDGRLYSMGWNAGKDTVYCIDTSSGKTLWQQTYKAPEYARLSMGDKSVYSGPSSTPEFDTETKYLYTLSLDGDLNCWDTTKKGQRKWGINLYDLYKPPRRPKVNRSGQRDYGYTSSPMVYKDWLIVEVGSKQGNVMAFDKRTGKRIWASKANDPGGHNGGPALMTIEGVHCLAVLNFNGLLVIRLDEGHEGETVATYPWRTEWANNIAGPAVFKNTVLITSEYNFKKICKLEITLKGAKKVWEKPFSSKACTPIIHKGHVYWVWRTVHCLDFETGNEVWEIRESYGNPGSCILTGDDRLIIWGGRGRLTLAETAVRSPKKAKVLSDQQRLTRQDSWPHVVLANRQLFLKDKSGRIMCFDLTGKGK